MLIVNVEARVVRQRTLVAAEEGEGDNKHNSVDKNEPDQFMKLFKPIYTFFGNFHDFAAGGCLGHFAGES